MFILAGAQFRPVEAQSALIGMEIGARVDLVPDPSNKYDPNAIQVIDQASGQFVGFVPKAQTKDVFPIIAEDGSICVLWSNFERRRPWFRLHPAGYEFTLPGAPDDEVPF
jgi:hypothetical protein